MPNVIPNEDKPFFDLTKHLERNRVDELEDEVARLNEMVTILMMGGSPCQDQL